MRRGRLAMTRTQINIGSIQLEIDQGNHVFFRDAFGKDVYRDWDDLSEEAKQEIKNTIKKTENLVRNSAEALWV